MLAACISLTACSDEKIVDYEQNTLEPLVINATPRATRTTLAEDGKSILWQSGDEIAVYDFTVAKHKFEMETFDGNKAQFFGKITAKKENFLVLYPYSIGADNLDADDNISVTLPTQQTAVTSNFAQNLNISVGKGKRNIDGSPSQLTFYNVCQLLKFEIPEYASNKISKIDFTANTAVAGILSINCINETPVASVSADGSKTITILPPSQATTFAHGTYYIVTAPVQMNGFSMSFTCEGTSYALSSGSTFGGEAGKIYSLGKIDLVNTPSAHAVHVYNQGVLMGTKLSLSNAPIEGKEWTVVVKKSNGITVRTLQGVGNLTSTEEDAAWPYLPQGGYTVEYSFESSNNKRFTKSFSFNVIEKPVFTVSTYAYTSFSYYKGDGVAKDIYMANSLDNMTIYEPRITINGIDSKILTNDNYIFTPESNLTSGLIGRNVGVFSYNTYKVNNLTSYSITGKVTFDGVSASSNKTVYITGLPYSVAPPTQSDWTGSAKSWGSDYVRLHQHTITKTFYSPENVNVEVTHSVYLYKSRAWGSGTPTYKLQCSGNTIAQVSASSGGSSVTDNKSYDGILASSNPTISCVNSAGSDDSWLTGEGSNTRVNSITVEYR